MFRTAFVSLALLAAPLSAQTANPAPVAELVKAVNIPHESFTLANGLRVIVSTDRKAPVVAVSVWYHVGSKDEPPGKAGFAHLFEHLMFNGSEHAPGDFFEPLQQIGATDFNGTTSFDRTNYFQTVPTPALERVLFLESDRMGHLLGGIDQAKLDNQRGVVENEKRQGDNEPYGLEEYARLEALFPDNHPYRHPTIGSVTDLDKASLADVKSWFRAKYGPNNAVLVLAGDIDAKAARPLVEKYFGDIPRGPAVTPIAADVPTLAAPKAETIYDRVATTRLYRSWAVPGLTDRELVPLDVAVSVLGGLSSSRLDNALVRGEKLAVSVSAGIDAQERVGIVQITANVRPGVDPGLVGKRLDAIVADFLKNGPTADEVGRVATREVSGRIRGLESVGGFGGKAVALAEGVLYAGDPDFYAKQLAAYAAVTPAQARAAARKWLSRPVYALTIAPGARRPEDQARAAGISGVAPPIAETADAATGSAPGKLDRSTLPPVGTFAALDFPDVTRDRLSNGIELVYARRDAVPVTRVAITFDAGHAADPKGALGTQSLMLALLDEGTTTRSSIQIAEEEERLGAGIGVGASMDRTNATLNALTANLAPSLDLLADIVRNPAFAPAEVERLRGQQLARIAAEMTEPNGLAQRALPPLLYGAGHPYGVPFSGTGDPAVVAKLTRADLLAFHAAWLRPDNAQIFVVGDRPLAEIKPMLERSFGTWRAPVAAKGVKAFPATTPVPAPRIVLIDRPGAPQSLILGGALLPLKGRDDLVALLAANDVLGGDFLSRLNLDLRETKGWAYGVNASPRRLLESVPYLVTAPVQADKTGAAIVALLGDMTEFLSKRGVSPAELERTVNGSIRELPGSFEGGGDVLAGMQQNVLLARPDDYYETLPARYRTLTAAQLDAVARRTIDPRRLVWVVVGDAATVRPQLDAVGLPVEMLSISSEPARSH